MTAFLYGANVQANGIRQHYLRYGGVGKPLVVVPGITSPAVTWGFVAERLCSVGDARSGTAVNYDVYILDVRGRGLSSSGPNLDYSLDALAQDLLAFIDALGLSNALVLGHSMGARIAMRAATVKTDFAGELMLVDPPVSGPGRRAYPSQLTWYLESIRLAEIGISLDEMRRFCPSWGEDQLRLRAEWLATCYEPAIVAAFEGFHNDDIHTDLKHLALPTGLMIAGRGNVISKADEDEIATLNPSIRRARVEAAGHMIPWDELDGFLEAFHNLADRAVAHV